MCQFREFTMPRGLKTLGGYAFSRCKLLKRVTLNEGLEKIGAGAF